MMIWIYKNWFFFCRLKKKEMSPLHLKVDCINCITIVPCEPWQPKWFKYKQDSWSCDGSVSPTVCLVLMILCILLGKGSTCWAGCWTDLHGQSFSSSGSLEAKLAEISPKICGAVPAVELQTLGSLTGSLDPASLAPKVALGQHK